MKYVIKSGEPAHAKTACLVLPRAHATAVATALGAGEQAALVLAGSKDKTGAVATVFRSGQPARLLAVGKDGKGKPSAAADFRKDMAALAAVLANLDLPDATLCLDLFDVADRGLGWKTATALTAIANACYRFHDHKSKRPAAAKLRRVGVLGKDRAALREAVRHAQALDAGLAFAKDLGNQPPNVCTPSYLAEQAGALAADDVTVDVVDEEEMQALGMGAFLSVTQGAQTPAKMIVVSYHGGGAQNTGTQNTAKENTAKENTAKESTGKESTAKENTSKEKNAPIALIGKGITFDTGGINLKSGATMGEMKFDMCGAACVLGVAKAAIAAKLPVNLIAIAAAAENMPSGTATRPSDIVTTMSKQTVEILNTDAEGRLVLCDALTYARRFKPRAVVDVATLTGAQVVALGNAASALYANDDDLASAIQNAGETSGDRLWRMPLWDEYQEQLKSTFADMKNIGGRAAGSITAACFLARFTKGLRWAHLDIAGTAYNAKTGSTGRPLPALYQWLRDAAA